jgi:hypothetical protein
MTPLTLPLALALTAGTAYLYWTRARRAAAELRWAFVRGGDEPWT